MGLAGLANIAAVVGGFVGVGQLLLQIFPFLQLKGEYASLRVALGGVWSSQDERHQSVFGNEKDWGELVQWLDRGTVILAPLQRRVLRRAVVALGSIVALVATALLDTSITPAGSPLAYRDIAAGVLAAVVPRLAFFKGWLLSEQEKRFLGNLRDLEEAFYRREVAPRLEVFNAVFDRLFIHVSGTWQDELSVAAKDIDELKKRVATLSAGAKALGPLSEVPLPQPQPQQVPAD